MPIDFEREYGVNAGYVQDLYERWQAEPDEVEESWRRLFERVDGRPLRAAKAPEVAAASPVAKPAPTPVTASSEAGEEDPELERLSGVAGRIVRNMEASLALPTATSQRVVPAKLLTENRLLLNEHLALRALGKASYTHLIAFALARALGEQPRVQSAYVERDGQAYRRVPEDVNLGLAIDVPGPKGRMLVVPSIKLASTLEFGAFLRAYDELVRRGREGALKAEDYAGTTVTLTNPGGFGTTASVPRLMAGQGLIIATGSIGVPAELAGAAPGALAQIAVGPVVTFTSTYDHRVVQGAESGLLLSRVDALLQGADGFYDEIFRAVRVPWTPHRAARDQQGSGAAARGQRSAMQVGVWKLIHAYRLRGYRLADLDPLAYRPDPLPSLDPATYGFSVWDLDREFLCGDLDEERGELPLREILSRLRRAYCRRWSVEYMHITEYARKRWFREHVESPEAWREFEVPQSVAVLEQLWRAENFERFLHASYVGNKRFSLEGADSLIPALVELLDRAAQSGVEKVVIGMAHRGRLNVLANILGKSHEQIFREFESVLLPLSAEGSGDVKYHLGQRGTYRSPGGAEIEIELSANPSHLEAVDPVVVGMTRAYQDRRGDHERKRVLAVLIHGDAAFSGQGVVAETFNMSALRAYDVGGTVHLVINNQIGFTARPRDLRSTYSCTDVAKSVEAPILHANGDFPESVLRAVRLAMDYRRDHGGDVVIDMVCYRRWGHNEGDEPAYTQPVLYAKIRDHPTPRENYTGLLVRRGTLTQDEADEIGARFHAELSRAMDSFQAEELPQTSIEDAIDQTDDDPRDYVREPSPPSGVPLSELQALIQKLGAIPEGHVAHPKLLRQLSRREQMVSGERELDWGCAEALAHATLLAEGVSIRLVGQDSGRGTFSHRHAVIRDQVDEAEFVPLARLAAEAGAHAAAEGAASEEATETRFEVHDSLLSEEAALGFEYGYALASPGTLVFWEAQFGDFANGAQIQIDQFVASGEAKWRQRSGLVLLLPHGFDGQGPEHSSARPERYLSLCSGGNMVVANCTTAAQYFHLVRRHGRTSQRVPLVLFTPKSLLRDRRAASPVEEFSTGSFRELIGDASVSQGSVRRVVLCWGKVYYDLLEVREERQVSEVALVRVEQLYPFPLEALEEELARYPQAELVWCQEEPRNMGAWGFVLQRFLDLGRSLRYCGRPESSSPATGSYRRHQAEQMGLVERALQGGAR